jgi:hypothetical protein
MAVLNHTSVRCLRFRYLSGWFEGQIFKLTRRENQDEDGQTLVIGCLAALRFNNTGESRVKLPVLKFNCGVADGDSLGFELKYACS